MYTIVYNIFRDKIKDGFVFNILLNIYIIFNI